jgi:hypothetical protein
MTHRVSSALDGSARKAKNARVAFFAFWGLVLHLRYGPRTGPVRPFGDRASPGALRALQFAAKPFCFGIAALKNTGLLHSGMLSRMNPTLKATPLSKQYNATPHPWTDSKTK